MLTDEQIELNKSRYLKLIKSISREGALIDKLVAKLEGSDFFTAPASTQYHCAYKGGLCQHSLNVYDQLCKLIRVEYPVKIVKYKDGDLDREKIEKTNPFTSDNLKIVALLHDISKMNFYEVSQRNVKNEEGKWTQVPFIKVKEATDRFLYGNHEQNSLYIASTFIPLYIEEEVAILHHMGGKGIDSTQENLTPIYNKYTLALLLHVADMLATYKDEVYKDE